MEQSKEIPELSQKSQLSRSYLMALGSVGHYIKQVEQFHESHLTDDPLPPRWLHLAERSLLHRPILKYQEYFSPTDFNHPTYRAEALTQIEKLNSLVDEVNQLLRQEGVLLKLKAKESSEFKVLKQLYQTSRAIVLSQHE